MRGDQPLDYPIALRLEGRPVLLVGAGRIATGRAAQLLEVGAKLRVVSPEAGPEFRAWANEGRLLLETRSYRLGDCAGAKVVFAASNAPEVNRAVADEARAAGILVNVADVPELCDFYVPALGRRGPVCIAVSTSGRAPGLASVIRDLALQKVGPEYGQLARLIGRLRRIFPPGLDRTQRLRTLVDGGAAELCRPGERKRLWRLIRSVSGDARRAPESKRGEAA